MSALERRLYCDNRGDAHGPVTATQTTAAELIEPAREAVTAEIRRRHHEAAEKEAREHEAAERREAEERKRNALAEADAARGGARQVHPGDRRRADPGNRLKGVAL